LFRAQSINFKRLSAVLLQAALQRFIRETEASRIREILSKSQFAIYFDVAHSNILGILLGNALRTFFEQLRILRCPPVAEVTLRVEFAPVVVESVCEFMAYAGGQAAEIHHIVHIPVKKKAEP
jgi:hypothetical protein